MNDIYNYPPSLAEAGAAEKNNDAPEKATRLRDRWEALRYGRAGRVLGYIAAFSVTFFVIFLFLRALEQYRF
jgi:hypothetical protein